MDHCNIGIKLMSKQIVKKTRTGESGTLARSMNNKPLKRPESISVFTLTSKAASKYYDFVDKGVKGVKNKSKAPQSKYRFKNLYTPPKMIESFMAYVSRVGLKSFKGTTLSYKGKNRKRAVKEHEKVAKQLAVMTKIGGIKPVDFISKANNPTRNKRLAKEIAIAMGEGIKQTIKLSVK